MSKKGQVRSEIEAALNTFTEEGFAEEIGFDAGPAGITAEVYGPEGTVAERFSITFIIEKIANETSN